MKGYKATDKDMRCRGFQFELGKWYEYSGELIECASGFHFCEYPSGPWAYYSNPGTRIFEIEADDVLEKAPEPGADIKRVCRRIKFVREIEVGGDKNTGYCNTGYCNTGDCNTGDCNTGYYNTGNRNTGYCNTGDCNTGDCNTGNCNTGNCNTGYYNTGNYNTGNRNTGYYNTGNYNTGNRNTGNCNTGYHNAGDCNTGYCNATDYSSGFFCIKEPKVISFDVQTKLTQAQFLKKYPSYLDLGVALLRDEPIEFKLYRKIPGITEKKLKALHKKFKEARKEK